MGSFREKERMTKRGREGVSGREGATRGKGVGATGGKAGGERGYANVEKRGMEDLAGREVSKVSERCLLGTKF